MATPQASAASDVLFAGSLSKRTKYTKKWKKYYWRVLNSGMLYYYKDVKHFKALGQMDIKHCCYDIRLGMDATSKVSFPSYIPKSCCISVSLTDRNHYLFAETPASASEWARVLGSVSGIVSRRRSETDAQYRELEKKRVALRNARQRRSKRNRPDTISVDLVLECVEAEDEDIEDPYVTILPPSPSQVVAHFTKKPSTATLLRRSASVPNALGDSTPNQLSIPVLFTASNSSMTSLYDDETAPRKPARVAPPPPKPERRRRSFGEDHPVLQRNTLLRETRKAYKKRHCASPEITSTTFTFGSLNDVRKSAGSCSSLKKNVINIGASPSPQSEASVEVVNVLQQSSVTTSPQQSSWSPASLRSKQSNATPVKRFANKEKIARRKSLPDCAISLPHCMEAAANNSFVFPVPPPRPLSTLLTPVNTPKQYNSTPVKRFTKMGPRRQSLPDFMVCPELSPISPTMVKQLSKDLLPPPAVATDRFHKTHQRRQSLPEFMPFAPVNNPENQKKLQKALGGARPPSVMAQQAMIAELQITSQLNKKT